MKVSVVVTCHNYAAYIAEAVDSVLGQQTPADEVIVVDDGSTDDSPRILESRYRDDRRVKTIRTPNSGQLAAFQTGVAAATGDLVAFLDADDRWRAGYLSAVTRKFTDEPAADIVIAQVRSFGTVEGRLWRTETRDRRLGYEVMRTAFQWHRNLVPTSGISMRTTLARQLMDVPADMRAEWVTRADDILVLGAALLGACKYVIAEPLVEYRVHGANLWFHGGTKDYMQHCRYNYRLNRLIQHFARANSVSPEMLRYAHVEFKTIERPIWEEFWGYAALCKRAPVPWLKVIRRWLLMSVYLVRSRRAARGQVYH